jgi:hypothetical protein
MADVERVRPGMSALLAEMRSAIEWTQSADVILTRLLTLGGRVPFADALATLTTREQGIVLRTLGDDSLRLSPISPTEPPPPAGDLTVGQFPQGRLAFRDAPPPDAHPLARLRLPTTALEEIDEEAAAWQLAEDDERAAFDSLLDAWHREGALVRRIREVADWVERVETVLIYVGDEVFSRSDAGTSTLLRGGRLERLVCVAPSQWTAAERLFVCSAQLLFASGRSARFEEFNGRQLSATGVRAWLLATWRRYAHAVGERIPSDLAARSAMELARGLPALSAAVDRSAQWVRFRRIKAPTFTKRETMARIPATERNHPGLPPAVRDFAADRVGWRADDNQPGEQAVSGLVGAIARAAAAERGPLIEGLLAAIVHGAALELDADYAMSSAVRDVRDLAPGHMARAAAVLRLRKPDFFCCVMPHPRLDQLDVPGRADLGEMLWTVAQRMQYNRWHFAPGNFDRTEVPADRHYFFPPALPDLADFSDLWHGGHIAAGVRSSIRAPGSQMWREPFDVADNGYRGCFDIRAVRSSGRPFGVAELRMAIRYCGLVDALWRSAVLNFSAAGEPLVVTAFGRYWYEERGWREALTGAPGDHPNAASAQS